MPVDSPREVKDTCTCASADTFIPPATPFLRGQPCVNSGNPLITLPSGQGCDLKGQENPDDIQHNSLSKIEKTIMLDKINTLFSDSIDNPKVVDRKPLQLQQL